MIELSNLNPDRLDPRLLTGGRALSQEKRRAPDLILIIRWASRPTICLSKVAEHTGKILGVYIMGKAATLNGVRGDVMIPTVVQDEHSHNTYLFQNAFSAADVAPFLVYGTVLDNQKAVSRAGHIPAKRAGHGCDLSRGLHRY